VVVGRRGAAARGESGGEGFVFAQPCSCRDEVEHFDDLGAEAAGVAGVAAECVLPGDASLFVGGRSERQVGDPEQSVMRDGAVTGSPHVR